MVTKTVATTNGTAGGLARINADGYPALTDPGALGGLVSALAANVGGQLNFLDLTQVRMPTGGSTQFTIPDAFGGDDVVVPRIRAVVSSWQPIRILFPRDDKGEMVQGSYPLCSSPDGKYPVPGGQFGDGGELEMRNRPVAVPSDPVVRRRCATCPMAQWGSSVKGERGQACQDRRLFFIQLNANDFPDEAGLPALMSIPPSSISLVRKQMSKLTMRTRLHFSALELEFGLEARTFGSNKAAVVTVRPVAVLEGAKPDSPTGEILCDEGSPAWLSRMYSTELTELLTPQVLTAASMATVQQNDGQYGGDATDDGLGGEFGTFEPDPVS